MKMLKKNSMFFYGVVCAVAVALAVAYYDGYVSKGETLYYSMSVFSTQSLPEWNPTNAVPLSVHQAVGLAIEFANKGRPKPPTWDVDEITLQKSGSSLSAWYYSIELVDRSSGSGLKIVRVLLNGQVWKPRKVE